MLYLTPIFYVLYLDYNVAFTFKWYGNAWNETFYSQWVWIADFHRLRVRFFGKIRKRITKSKKRILWVFFLQNPKTDHESKVSTLEEDTSD